MHSAPPTLLTTGGRGFRAVAVALLSLALAAGALVATPASAATPTGRISGVVTSAATGEALSGISVTLLGAFDPLAGEDYIASDDTDAAGQYSFTRLPQGDYRVIFEDYGDDEWDPETGEPIVTDGDIYLTQFYGGSPSDQTGDVPSFALGSSALTINQALTVSGTYTGKVLTSEGKPAKKVYVYAVTEGYDSYYGNEAVTKSNGTFTIRGIGYGPTTLYTDSTRTSPSMTVIPTPISAETPKVSVPTIKLVAGSFITGRLLTPEGKPAARHYLVAEPVSGDASEFDDYSDYSSTDSKGHYRLGPLLPGTYAPKVADLEYGSTSPEYLGGSTDIYLARTITLSKPGSVATREFRMAKRAKLTGTIRTFSGAPAKNLPVIAVQLDGTGTLTSDYSSLDYTQTNSKGKYTISGLNPGSYATGFGELPTSAGAPISRNIALGSGTTTLDRRLGAVTTVSGVVTSSAGLPLKGVEISAIPVGDTECSLGSYYAYYDEPANVTSATGAYSITLPAGDWALRFTDPTGRTGSAYLGGGTYLSDDATTIVSVSGAGKVPGQNVALSTGGADISAYIHTSTGADDIDGIVSVARVIDGEIVDSDSFYACNGVFDYFGEETLNESFPLQNLADGDYRATLQPMINAYGFVAVDTVIEFTVADGILSTVDGEPATDPLSLGDVELSAPVRSTTPDDREKPGILALDGTTVGATLTAITDYPGVTPEWSEYSWLRDGRPIAGANSASYVVQPGDVGSVLTVQFSGWTGTDYIQPILSTPSAVVTDAELPVAENVPTISGSGRVGETLTAVPAPGDPAGTTYGFQWSINGQDLLAVTSKTFTPRIQDYEETITVTVTKTLPDSSMSIGATSAGVTIKLGKAIVLGKPKLLVSGNSKKTLRLGTTLSASNKGLPKDSVGVSYQWQLNRGSGWKTLSGAISSTYTLSEKKTSTSGVGYSYRLVVSIERSGYEPSKPVTSNTRKAARASRG